MFEKTIGERDAGWMLAALLRRWWIIVLVAVIGGAAAYVLAKQQTKQYTATSALLFIDSPLAEELIDKQIVDNTVDPTREAATNQALVELPAVSRLVARRLHVPVATVKSAIGFGSTSTSDVMTITATSSNPTLAADIANTYVQQYISFRKASEISELTTSESLINQKITAIPLSRQNTSVAQSLISDRNELDLLSSAQTGDAQVVQTATRPTSPSSPKPAVDALLGLVLGLMVGTGLAALVEWRDRRIKTIAEVESIYGAPVIGTVPESAALRRGSGGTPRDQEAFLMLRAHLRYFDVGHPVQTVMVTSAESGEGKSLITLNLARAIALASKQRTLLIEADLRVPGLHKVVRRGNVAGLAELLGYSQDLEAGLRELVVTPDLEMHQDTRVAAQEGLDFLLAGSVPPNPTELLESDRMNDLLEVCRTAYDVVVIDTPPIGIVSDAIPLVHQVDGIVVVSRIGVSQRDSATRLMGRLRELSARVLGVVVNSYSPPSDSSYAYYAYGSESPTGTSGRGRSPRRNQVAGSR